MRSHNKISFTTKSLVFKLIQHLSLFYLTVIVSSLHQTGGCLLIFSQDSYLETSEDNVNILIAVSKSLQQPTPVLAELFRNWSVICAVTG